MELGLSREASGAAKLALAGLSSQAQAFMEDFTKSTRESTEVEEKESTTGVPT